MSKLLPGLRRVNEILTELYLSDDLNSCINKFINRDYRDDFKNDLFLYLKESCSERLIEMDARKETRFFLARIIINASKNKSGWRKPYEPTPELPANLPDVADTFDINERLLFEEKEEKMIGEIENLDDVFNSPFYKGVLKALEKHESMRAVSRETGIPRQTISRAIKKIREHLKDKFK